MLKTVLTIVLLATAVPAAAQIEQVTRQVHVSYADLDLRRPNDLKIFDRRLRVAIGQVCPEAQPQDRAVTSSVLRCRHGAHVNAADQRAAAIAAANARTQLAAVAGTH